MLATIIEHKKCIDCEQYFDVSNFYKIRSIYYSSYCKSCDALRNKQMSDKPYHCPWVAKHKDGNIYD